MRDMYHVEEYEIVSKTYENEHRGSEQVASSFPTLYSVLGRFS